MMNFLIPILFTCLTFLYQPLVADDFPTLQLGAAAPQFNLPGIDGRNWTLKDFVDAKILVVAFTCKPLSTAQYYQERIKQIVTDYKNKGVSLVAIYAKRPQVRPT